MNIIKCRIAGFNVLFKNDIKHFQTLSNDYLCDFNESEPFFKISIDDIEVDDAFAEKNGKRHSYGLKMSTTFRRFAEKLPKYNAFVLHSACFDVDGVGVAFAAHSGTGKTTHMNLWQKLLGDKMVVVNGDKPIVRFFDDEPETPYAYGTPWNGKEHYGCNMRTKLRHICFIERSETNFVEPLEKAEAIDLIFNQVFKPSDPVSIMNTMQLIDRLLSCCKVWKIHCNMEDDAAKVAYETIFNS